MISEGSGKVLDLVLRGNPRVLWEVAPRPPHRQVTLDAGSRDELRETEEEQQGVSGSDPGPRRGRDLGLGRGLDYSPRGAQ